MPQGNPKQRLQYLVIRYFLEKDKESLFDNHVVCGPATFSFLLSRRDDPWESVIDPLGSTHFTHRK